MTRTVQPADHVQAGERPLIALAAVPPRLTRAELGQLARLAWTVDSGRPLPYESLVGRALARRLVGRCLAVDPLDVRVDLAPTGRPFGRLPDGTAAPAFSLSHSAGWVAAAVSPAGRVGVDLEKVTSVEPRILERVFAPSDGAWVRGLAGIDRDRAFAHLWTVAEAAAKATGVGVGGLLRRLRPIGGGPAGTAPDGLFWASGEPVDGYWCAVAADTVIRPDDVTDRIEASLEWILS